MSGEVFEEIVQSGEYYFYVRKVSVYCMRVCFVVGCVFKRERGMGGRGEEEGGTEE
jgi:hypothetical protein